jgi:hypothetical protein
MHKIFHNQEGISALLVVVVILAVIISLGLLVSKISINELALSLDEDQSNRALHIAEACEEEATFRLKRDSGYTGGSITIVDGTCTVVVTGGGSTRSIDVTSTYGNETRDLTVDVTLEANLDGNADGIDVTNWEEN